MSNHIHLVNILLSYQSTFWLAMTSRVKHLFLLRVPWYFSASALSLAFSTLAVTAWTSTCHRCHKCHEVVAHLGEQWHLGHELSLLGASSLLASRGLIGVGWGVSGRCPPLAGPSVPATPVNTLYWQPDVPSLARHQSPLGVYFVQPVIVNRGDVLIWQAEYQQTLTVQGTDQTMDSPPAECGDIGGKVLLEVDKRNLGGMLDLGGNDLNNVDMSFGGKSWKIWEFSDGFVQTKITWKIDNLQTFVILTRVVSSCVQENLNASRRRQIISPKSANITSPLTVHWQF